MDKLRVGPIRAEKTRESGLEWKTPAEAPAVLNWANGWDCMVFQGAVGGGLAKASVARRSVGKIRKVVMDRRFSKNRLRVPIFFIALRHRSSAKSQTVWKAKARRFRETNTAERLFLPWPKLCSRLYPLFFRTLKLSFSIFQRARPQAARSTTVSGPTSRSVTKLLR